MSSNHNVEILLLFCRCLRPSLDAAEATRLGHALAGRSDQIESLIELANAHYLTPALWRSLEDKGLADRIPPDAREFLRQAHRLNRIRNGQIREQALELVTALNDADITPVMLKGGVHLFEGDGRAFDTRMMVDLDILVPKPRLEDSVAVARRLGYGILAKMQDWTHEYHPLGRPGDTASVEFHKDVGEQRDLLSADEAIRRSVPLGPDNLRLRALCPTDRILQNVFHSQIQDRNHGLWRVPLRYLHDLSLILRRQGDAIDWPEIRAAMAGQGYGEVLEAYLYQGQRLLALPRPPSIPQARRARRHYQRCLAQMRLRPLRRLLALWGIATQPFGRWRVEYIYGAAPNCLALNVNRLRRVGMLAKTYGDRPLKTLFEFYQRIYSK